MLAISINLTLPCLDCKKIHELTWVQCRWSSFLVETRCGLVAGAGLLTGHDSSDDFPLLDALTGLAQQVVWPHDDNTFRRAWSIIHFNVFHRTPHIFTPFIVCSLSNKLNPTKCVDLLGKTDPVLQCYTTKRSLSLELWLYNANKQYLTELEKQHPSSKICRTTFPSSNQNQPCYCSTAFPFEQQKLTAYLLNHDKVKVLNNITNHGESEKRTLRAKIGSTTELSSSLEIGRMWI